MWYLSVCGDCARAWINWLGHPYYHKQRCLFTRTHTYADAYAPIQLPPHRIFCTYPASRADFSCFQIGVSRRRDGNRSSSKKINSLNLNSDLKRTRLSNGRKIGYWNREWFGKSVPLFVCIGFSLRCTKAFRMSSLVAVTIVEVAIFAQAYEIIIFLCSVLIKTKISWLVNGFVLFYVCSDRSNTTIIAIAIAAPLNFEQIHFPIAPFECWNVAEMNFHWCWMFGKQTIIKCSIS